MRGKILIIPIIILLSPTFTHISVAQQEAVIRAYADASIRSDYRTVNYGTYTYLWVGELSFKARSLLKFDFSSIPSSARVLSAKLRLTIWKKPSSTIEVRAHRVLEDWLEDQVTWIKRGIAVSWTDYGGYYSSSVEGSVTISSSASRGDVYEMDVTDYVSDVVSGSTDYGLILEGDGEGSIVMFYSSESAYDPEIIVEYTLLPIPSIPPINGFTVSISPSSQSTTPGGSAAYTVEVQGFGGFTDKVFLTVSGIPPGSTYYFTSNNQAPPYTSTLTIQTSHSTPPGTYTVEVTGTGGGKTSSETATLEVESTIQPDFQLRPLTMSQTVNQGETATYSVKVESIAGFSDQVELSVQYLPSGCTATVSPETGTPTFTATITIETSEQTQPGAYTIEVVATTYTATKTAHIKLIVLPSTQPTTSPPPTSPPSTSPPPSSPPPSTSPPTSPPSTSPPPSSPPPSSPPASTPPPSTPSTPPSGGFDFSVSVDPSSVEIYPGESATISVSVDLLSGRSRQVRIVVEGLPSEHSYTVQPELVKPPAVAVLTITAGSSTGTYTVKVKGVSGRIERAAELTVTVKASRCLIVTATYGSELSWQVVMLRRFRDEKVMSTRLGNAFMEAFNMVYYSFSPQASRFISKHGILRMAVKLLLYPLINILRVSEHVASNLWWNAELAILVSGITACILIGFTYLSVPLLIVAARLSIPLKHLLLASMGGLLFTVASFYLADSLLALSTSILAASTILSAGAAAAKLLQSLLSYF